MQPYQGGHIQQAPQPPAQIGGPVSQAAMTPPPHPHPQKNIRHPNAPRPVNEQPVRPLNFSETSSRVNTRIEKLSTRVGGKDSLLGIIIAAFCFLLLFAILSIVKFANDNKQYKAQETRAFSESLVNQAIDVSRRIDTEIAAIDSALFTQATSKQIVDYLGQFENIEGVALLDATGTLISRSGEKGEFVSQLDPRNFPNEGVQITSLVTPEGISQPVIVRRRGDVFLLAILAPQSLVGSMAPDAALIWDGGRVIDGGTNINTADALTFYNIGPQRLAGLIKSSTDNSLIDFEIRDQKVWLGTSRVPKSKSTLSVINIQKRAMSPMIFQNILLFTLLMLGTAWLVWMLITQLVKQLDMVREQQTSDEVSKQRYQAAVDGSKGGVWEIDLAKNTAYLSPSLAKVFNMPEDHIHLPMSQFLGLFAASDRERLFGAIRRSHVNGDFDVELGLAHLPIYMACRGRPSVRGSDQARIIIGMALDITEIRGAQARLQAAEARLVDAMSSMSDSFVIWDQMDRLILWNHRFESFFGFQPGQLQVGIDHATVDYYARQVVASMTERPEGNEVELKDGRWIRYSETHTVDGGRVSIGTEITAIRSREHELQVNQDALEKTINILRESQVRIVELAESYEQEKIRAEEASQSKTEFLANMSHELRTPLNAINGFSDIMKKELFGPLGDPRYKEYVNDILFSGQHLLSLINDILDMSKIEAGKMTLNTENLNINEMISQVIRIVRGRADENRLKLVFQEIEARSIEADPRAVKQVLLNLMTNAIKFTPEGGAVSVIVEPKSAGLIIHVSDTGIGISKEDLSRLAQPFEQIDSQHSRKHEGTGLGLALSKSLVELHGGNFKINSVVGEGTTVTFTLPLKPPTIVEKPSNNEVGSEITRLANDIADVLSVGEASIGQRRVATVPVQETAPRPVPQAPQPSPPPPTPPQYVPEKHAQGQNNGPVEYQPQTHQTEQEQPQPYRKPAA